MSAHDNFYYLNRENGWRDFQSIGLDLRPDGAFQLATVPRLADEPPADLEQLPTPEGPAGLAVGPSGMLYYSQPSKHRLMQIEACEGRREPLVCLGGEGSMPTRLRRPRGLLYHRPRGALFVADSENGRVQVFDTRSWQLQDVWGVGGELHAPQSLAADPQGNVYVADITETAGRVVKFDVLGQLVPEFWDTAQAAVTLQWPVAIDVGAFEEHIWIYVLDAGLQAVIVFTEAGQYVTQFGQDELQDPLALAATEADVYVGDNGRRRVLKYKLSGLPQKPLVTLSGPAHGFEGPVAALATGPQGALWLHPGGEHAPLSLEMGGGFAHSGVLWGGPFGPSARSVSWQRLKAIVSGVGEGAHVQLYFHGGLEADKPPLPPDLGGETPFAASDWQALPLDATDGLIPPTKVDDPAPGSISSALNLLPEAPYLWVGAHLMGEGLSSPVLKQAHVSYDHETYRQHLPALFSLEPEQADLLDRLLYLYESFYADVEATIASLDHLFDPQSVPTAWLPWLAGWLALELDDNWPETKQREAIRQAMELYAWRGTVRGLKQALRFFAAVEAHIEEPIQDANWWALAEGEDASPVERQTAVLGFTTRLAPTQAEGAVLGGTAALDRSNLIDADDYGAPLFEHVAHQFTVQVYRGQVRSDQDLARVRAVIEREKPAHTLYHLCVIEPRMRVGFQARLGIDTIVAGPLPPSRMDGTGAAGVNLMLGGDPPGRMGTRSQVGQTTRLTEGSTK